MSLVECVPGTMEADGSSPLDPARESIVPCTGIVGSGCTRPPAPQSDTAPSATIPRRPNNRYFDCETSLTISESRWEFAFAHLVSSGYGFARAGIDSLGLFRERVLRYWGHALQRRSQTRRYAWVRRLKLAAQWLPIPRALHPWPFDRFAATHPR